MNLGFSMLVLSLMATPIMSWSWRKNGRMLSSDAAFDTVVASVFVCGIADGLVGGSLVGTAGKLPKQYMQAIFAGTASSGKQARSRLWSISGVDRIQKESRVILSL